MNPSRDRPFVNIAQPIYLGAMYLTGQLWPVSVFPDVLHAATNLLFYLRMLQQITKGGLIIISITCCNRSTISSTVLFENVATNGGYALFENVATDNEGGIIITSCHSCNR